MTVRELIDCLKQYDPEKSVFYANHDDDGWIEVSDMDTLDEEFEDLEGSVVLW